jgi:shikimate 5-dehydrogenase
VAPTDPSSRAAPAVVVEASAPAAGPDVAVAAAAAATVGAGGAPAAAAAAGTRGGAQRVLVRCAATRRRDVRQCFWCMLQVCVSRVSDVSSGCCKCFVWML